MMKKLLFISIPVVLLTFAGASVGDERCENFVFGLSSDENLTLKQYGFVYLMEAPNGLPNVVISDDIISNCRARHIAEKYFTCKVSGNDVFEVTEYELEFAKKEISKAVFYALDPKNNNVWVDGLSHEIYNIVSDELLPDWWEFVSKKLALSDVDLDFFTWSMWENPDKSIIPAIERGLLNESLSTYHVSLLLFLKKNVGVSVDMIDAERRLRAAHSSNGEIDEEEIMVTALNLLKKANINYSDALEFNNVIYGPI